MQQWPSLTRSAAGKILDDGIHAFSFSRQRCVKPPADLEVLDLENPWPEPVVNGVNYSSAGNEISGKRGFGFVTPSVADNSEGETPTSRRVEQDVETLKREVARLENRLHEELQPRLAEGMISEKMLKARSEELNVAYQDFLESQRRAPHSAAGLSKRALSEIRHLARNPPDMVRRTLTMAWMLMNNALSKEKLTEYLSDAADWMQCQKMLAEDNFATRMLSVDAACLDDVSDAMLHVLMHHIGLDPRVGDALPNQINSCTGKFRKPSKDSLLIPLNARADSKRSASSPSLKGLPSAEAESVPIAESDQRRSYTKSLPRLPHVKTNGQSKRSLLSSVSANYHSTSTQLDVKNAQHASGACGALLQWMHGLFLHQLQRRKARKAVMDADLELKAAEQQCRSTERAIVEVEHALAEGRKRLRERAQSLQHARHRMPRVRARRIALPHCDFGEASPCGRWSPKNRPRDRGKGALLVATTNLCRGEWYHQREFMN
eukprot:TRINITY_DN8181_c1_g4_i1.p1 TRINITY_DN8181_c1_g4~~TRINITY_DN8181_c1_g4_i1.p1  ORF type:complete len:491 (-),score=78.20 TRINITY_DN8181_c1_g4_i1:377-1849(-)